MLEGAQAPLQQGLLAAQALLHADRITPVPGEQRQRADWQSGRLNVLDDPLEQVVDALRPYTRGFGRVAPEVRQ